MSLLLMTLVATTTTTAPNVASDTRDLAPILTRHTHDRYVGDLDEIKKRGVLRVLTRNNSASYFIARGRQLGFQYEMTKAFADKLGVRLAIVVPTSRAGLIPALLKGEGDLIAAGMSATPERAKLVALTPPLFEAPRVVATHRDIVKELTALEHVPRFEVHVDFRSTTYAMGKSLEEQLGVPIRLGEVPPEVEMEEMLRRVGSGEYEATIVDRNVLVLEQADGVPVTERVEIGPALPKVWAVRPSSPALAEAASEFVRRSDKNGLSRIQFAKYYRPQARNARKAREHQFRADEQGGISPYDAIFKKEGERTDIDWRLLAAIAFAESRFRPKAKSRFGASGLMQLMPSTARQIGGIRGDDERVSRRLLNPATNIRVGASYVRWLMRRFEAEGVEPRQQIRFALAAYNAGLGHIFDARELATKTGRNPNRWFHHVAEAILLKKDPRWHHQTRYGFCRADQTVNYVSRIQTRYDVYVRHVSL